MAKNKIILNYLYSAAYQIMLMILPLLASPYISRVLGAENIGVYSYTYSIVFYFGVFANLGINHYGNRAIAKCRDEKVNLNYCFSSIFFLHLILSVFVILIYYVYIFLFVDQYIEIFFIQSIYLFSVLFDISWFYFGIEEFKLTVGRNAIIKIFTTILIFFVVKSKSDLWVYTVILVVGTIMGNISLWFFLPKYVKFVKPRFKDILAHLKPMAVLAISVIAVSVYLYIDKIMLGKMSSMEQLGYFENAFKMIEFPIGLITAMGTVMLPRISNLVASEDAKKIKEYISNSMKLIAVFSPAIAFGLASIADVFSVVFWGKEFKECGTILGILSLAALLITWNNIVRTEYLIPQERDISYVKAVCTGAIVNVLLNVLLLSKFGGNGAAVSTIGAYLSVFLIQNWSARKDLEIKKYLKFFVPYMVIAIIMFISVRLINHYIIISVWGLIIRVMVGAIIYIVLALIWIKVSNDSFLKKYLEKLRIRKK